MTVLMMLSREIRCVPLDYEPPRIPRFDYRTMTYVDDAQPVFDLFYVPTVRAWLSERESWQHGTHPRQQGEDPPAACCSFEEWEGNGPNPDYYYPGESWPKDAAMGIRMYESVSEGTPISAVYPNTSDGKVAMARELATRETGITPELTEFDWLDVIEQKITAIDVHTGALR